MTINLDNLRSGYEKFAYAFDKCKTCVTKGLPYDCRSIMHYPNDAFAAGGKKTIVSKNETIYQTFTNGRHIILMFCRLALPWASLSPYLADRLGLSPQMVFPSPARPHISCQPWKK